MPFLGCQLRRERGAGIVAAQFHELEQELARPIIRLVHEIFADREQRVRGSLGACA